VAPDARPIPFLVEGTAQAIGCNTRAGIYLAYDDVPWQQAVVSTAKDTPPTAVYSVGGLFARYLIRTQGIDAFIRYYRQAPGRRDPALFAANFSAFWNLTVDDVWTAMHVVQPGADTSDDSICPCSLSALPTDGQPIPFDVARPYWTIGDTQGASIGVTAPGGGAIIVRDCEGVGPALSSVDVGFPSNKPKLADTHVGIIHLADGRSHYIPARVTSASVGDYLADDCAGATPYALPADFLSGSGSVWVLCSPALGEDVTEYLRLQVPFAARVTPVQGVAICDSCDFASGSCPLLTSPGVSSPVVPGPLNVALPPPHILHELAALFGTATVLHFTK